MSIGSTLVALTLACALMAPAQVPNSQVVFAELSIPQMRGILQGMGFEFTEVPTANNQQPVTFRFQLNGYKVALFDYGSNLQLYLKFSDKIDPARASDWNRQYRYSRAYADTDGGAVLESDLPFDGGITRASVEEFIKTFRLLLDPWAEFVAKGGTSGNSTSNSASAQYVKGATAKMRVAAPFGKFNLWIDEDKWKPSKADETGVLTFENVNGEGYARIITEKIGIPTGTLKDVVLANTKKFDSNAKVTFEETRTVNGKQVLALQLAATSQGVPFRFYGYYHGGTSGTIQVVTYTAANLFDNNLAAFTEFLDGLEILDEELTSAPASSAMNETGITSNGLLLLNAGKMSVKYDPKKWKQTESNEIGRFTFQHKNGDGYAMIIAERINVPAEALPDIALSNMREADPNATVVLREKRKINGGEVWFLKFNAEVNKIPVIYLGYYFSDKNGAVQVITYTGKNFLPEYEKDFTEFLNGLIVSE